MIHRAKARNIALDAVYGIGTIKCRSRGIHKQSHFALCLIPSRYFFG